MVAMNYKSEISKDEPVYSISVAAKLLGVSIPTLRIYEKEGLLLPFKKASGTRLYSPKDLERIDCFRRTISEKKISINGIKSLLSVIPCWDIIKCSDAERNSCPAYNDNTQPCWAYENKPDICANKDCRSCHIYAGLSDCTDVKNFIKNI